ncbi:MAG: hypothetical protein ABSE07_07590 [Methanoregula sp.]
MRWFFSSQFHEQHNPILVYPATNAAITAITSGGNPVPKAGSSLGINANAMRQEHDVINTWLRTYV